MTPEQIAAEILKLIEALSDDDRYAVLAKLRERFCTQCGQAMDGNTCWNCYDSPVEWEDEE